MIDQKYIGFDPVAWVERLIEVNSGSAFATDEKMIIDWELRQLKGRLQKEAPNAN